MHTPQDPPASKPATSLSHSEATPKETPEARKARRLADPKLHASIRAMLKKHGAGREQDDLFQDTLLAAWKSPHVPDEDEPSRKYTCGIARRLAKKWVEKDALRLEHHAEAFDPDKDEHVGVSAGSLEARLVARAQLAALADKVQDSEKRAYRWLLRNALGESLYEIAGEEGLAYMNVYKATARLRERLENAKRFFTFLVLLGGGSIAYRRQVEGGDVLVGAAPDMPSAPYAPYAPYAPEVHALEPAVQVALVIAAALVVFVVVTLAKRALARRTAVTGVR